MEEFGKVRPAEQRTYFEGTAAQRNMQAHIIEKDFWVCWTLRELFRLPQIGEHLIFKGGTSLSKVFKVIERFSEDIDVSIDRSYLGFGGANEPEAGSSNKEKQRRIEALKTACQAQIVDELRPAFEEAIGAKVRQDEQWALNLDEDDPDKQTLMFEYPTSFPPQWTGYIRRAVKIEMGARADHWPWEMKSLAAYVAEQYPQGVREPSCTVKVLSIERTFWEKATILHAEFHRAADKPMPGRFSRHYCDLFELISRGIASQAVSQPELLKRVAEHKSLFFRSSWARYGEAASGTLRVSPPAHRIEELRRDFDRMQEMFFGEPPEFEAMIATLQRWEDEFNG